MSDMASNINDPLSAEWIILADHAEVLNNKLYVMGGGWDTVTVPNVPYELRFAIVVALQVPWHDTNQLHNIEIELLDEDGGSHMMVQGQVEAGRPPGIVPGQTQRIQLAVSTALRVERIGTFSAVVRMAGSERVAKFHVVTMPAFPAPG